MLTKSSILIATDNINMYECLIQQLDLSDIDTNQSPTDCISIEIAVLRHEPDIVIIERDNNDMEELQRLVKNILLMKKKPYIFTLSSYEDSYENQVLLSSGVSKCISIPFVLSDLYNTIQKYINMTPVDTVQLNSEINKSITDLLAAFHLHSGIQGYNYLRKALIITIMNCKSKPNFSKEVYPEIADTFETNVACVEWSIRSAINKAWNKTDQNVKDFFFPANTLKNHAKPTNNEFITLIGDLIKDEYIDYIQKIDSQYNDENYSSPPMHKV